MTTGTTIDEPTSPRAAWRACLETLAVFAVFAVYAGWPVPEPNEPHYLAKAKHFWDPAWIEHDFFLDSADSHWTFYVVAGWPSLWLSLPAFAWAGRVATWMLLAVAWRRLSFSLVPRSWAAILSAALFVALNENFHMAGEWVVGGFEAKGIAYALVFAALAELVRGRWNFCWVLLGAASAFHVLVGGWATLAVIGSWWWIRSERPSLPAMAPGLVAGLLLSLPGLIPALALSRDVDPTVLAAANHIYVYERLRHHLSPLDFPRLFVLRFAALAAVWGLLCWFTPAEEPARRLRRAVHPSLLFVVVGLGVGVLGHWRPDLAASLLKFYWFRLADVFVPVGVALLATAAAYRPSARWPSWRRLAPIGLAALACGLIEPNIVARFKGTVPRADKPEKVKGYADWRDACQWIAENTPRDARFLTPRNAQTFKWYAGHSEVVTWKDMPQDAASIVEWWRRLRNIHGTDDPDIPWFKSLTEPRGHVRTPTDVPLVEINRSYGARYLLTESDPPLDFPRPYRNNTYAVYELPKTDHDDKPGE